MRGQGDQTAVPMDLAAGNQTRRADRAHEQHRAGGGADQRQPASPILPRAAMPTISEQRRREFLLISTTGGCVNNSVRREMQNSTVIHFSGRPFRLLAALAGGLLPGALGGKPIAFDFSPQKAEGIQNPFARELWAEVSPPSGRKLILPAFYVAEGRFEVRVRAEQLGTYKFGGVLETTEGRPASAVSCQPVGPAEFENHAKERLPAIIRDPKDAHGFIGTDGRLFVPVGANTKSQK